MIDLQSSSSYINIAINKVGVKDISYPITVVINEKTKQPTIANFNMYVDLKSSERGTHMSRFMEILNSKNWELSLPAIDKLLNITKDKLKSNNVFIEANFKIFLEKLAPISRSKSLMDYDVKFTGELIENKSNFNIELRVPVTTLCPCSKELAKYNAHNQRSYVTVNIKTNDNLDIEKFVNLIESSGSCGVFGVLKREDEKYVTETAYENPKFVEDIAREIAEKFNKDKNILRYSVKVENLESIHNHAAYAEISS